MLKVQKGGVVRSVTSGVYKALYEPAGWKPVDDGADAENQELTGQPPTDAENQELTDDELLEKPVGEMKSEELKRAASIIGYDYQKDGVTIKQLPEKLAEKLAAR